MTGVLLGVQDGALGTHAAVAIVDMVRGSMAMCRQTANMRVVADFGFVPVSAAEAAVGVGRSWGVWCLVLCGVWVFWHGEMGG